MRWDRLFEDIEDQLASEWEAERVALDSEAERLRLSRVALRERLEALVPGDGEPVAVALELHDGTVVRAPVGGLGSDWLLAAPWGARAGAALIPLASLSGVSMPHADLLRTARPRAGSSDAVSRRATFGYAVRDLVRRRVGVRIHLLCGRAVDGTVDRAGVDHLDLAMHEPGAVRRAGEVTGYRIVPFAAIGWIAVLAGAV